jgi:hypothetical protein
MTDKRKNRPGLAAAFFLLTAGCAAVFSMSITAEVSPDSALVGDELTLSVTVAGVPKGAAVVPPETEKGFGDFSVLSWEDASAPKGAKGKERDSSVYKYRYGVAAYKPENCTIPSIKFLIGADTLSTRPIPIKMLSALPLTPPDSGGFALKDLKAQQRVGKADIRYLWVILAVAVVVAALMLILRRFKKKGGAAVAPAVPLLPPYEEAVEAIAALEGKKYLERGMVREYVFELSELFKRYIGRRYETIAPELTTDEIVSWLEFSEISREMRLCAERFFRSGDQVKFAKFKPDKQSIEGYMRDVKTFIEATKPDPTLPYERKTERMGEVE